MKFFKLTCNSNIMILTKEDLLEEERKGNLIIKNREEYGPYSLDISVEKLFRRNKKFEEKELDMSQAEWIENCLEEIEFGKIEKGKLYHVKLNEAIYLGKDLLGEITTRSSWARKGLAIRSDSDDYLNRIQGHAVKPLCILYSSIDIDLKKNDKIGQLIISNDYPLVLESEMMELYHSKKLVVEDAIVKEENIFLTMNKKIFHYNNGFKEKNIEHGLLLDKNDFFLSASQQHIEIPEGYCGYVIESLPRINQTKYFIPFTTHANAPYIQPKNIFKGNIVFENTMRNDGVVYEGMLQSQLILKKLSNKCSGKSRYDNQKGVTKSKI